MLAGEVGIMHQGAEFLGGTVDDSHELTAQLAGCFGALQEDPSFVTLVEFYVGVESRPDKLHGLLGIVCRRLSYCESALRWASQECGATQGPPTVLRLPELRLDGVTAVLQWAHEGRITIPALVDIMPWCFACIKAAQYLGAPRVEVLCVERAVAEAIDQGPHAMLAVLDAAMASASTTLSQHIISELAKPGAFVQAATCSAWETLSTHSMLQVMSGAKRGSGSVGLGAPEVEVLNSVVRWAVAKTREADEAKTVREVVSRVCYPSMTDAYLQEVVRNVLCNDIALGDAVGLTSTQGGREEQQEWGEAIIDAALSLRADPERLCLEANRAAWLHRSAVDWRQTPLELVFRLAEEGHVKACAEVGFRFFEGREGCKQDLNKAQKWLAEAAEAGHCQASVALAELYLCANQCGRVRADKLARAALRDGLESLAAAGDAEAQMRLGWLYFEGMAGITKNYHEAACWCRQAADQDHLSGIFSFACMLWAGYGLSKDEDEAVRLWRCAATRGHAWSKSRLRNVGRSVED